LVGAALAARLAARGDDVVRVARSGVGTVNIDLANSREPVDWVPHLAGIEAVVNCAGVEAEQLLQRWKLRGFHGG
jgi:uncharacterized protein YbjT (DUF2867 family)